MKTEKNSFWPNNLVASSVLKKLKKKRKKGDKSAAAVVVGTPVILNVDSAMITISVRGETRF